MNKKTWDLYAPIYKRAMKADQKIYDFMYERIPEMVKDKDILELATGPGLLAKHIAPAAKAVLATDYSDGMIAEATVFFFANSSEKLHSWFLGTKLYKKHLASFVKGQGRETLYERKELLRPERDRQIRPRFRAVQEARIPHGLGLRFFL